LNRNYSSGFSEKAEFFVGTEVEHSPALGQRTLFVVGVQDPTKVIHLAKSLQCPHVYFGANQSFPMIGPNDATQWAAWTGMIESVLQKGLLCTLDLDVSCTEGLAESSLVEYNNFITMISVKIPYVQLMGYNAVVKIDDKGFRATNPGVWCHSLHDLKNRKVFTDWSKYTNDEIIQEKSQS
jgi:hypothetical protein